MNKQKLIGIDPDCVKSGLAMIDYCGVKTFKNLTFFNLFDYLKDNLDAHVYLEAGHQNKSNWHLKNANPKVAARIGNNTGANHEVGRKIIEMLEYLKIEYTLCKPNKKTRKLNAKNFIMQTGIKERLNQEQRDAYMLIHGRD